jgi:hypothetical protein
MTNADGGDPRERLLSVLLDKVAEELYPSSTMLDVIEQLLTPDDVGAYAAVLTQKIADEVYPSMSTLKRLLALSGA